MSHVSGTIILSRHMIKHLENICHGKLVTQTFQAGLPITLLAVATMCAKRSDEETSDMQSCVNHLKMFEVKYNDVN